MTSTQLFGAEDSRTASVIRAARSPSAKVGRPSGAPTGERGVGVGDEGVEAVLVALRVTGGHRDVAGGRRRVAGAAQQLPVRLAATDPERCRGSPGRRLRLSAAPSTENHSRFLRPGADLADRDVAGRAAIGLEQHHGGVLGRAPAGRRASGTAISVWAASRGDPVAGDELDEVAPVHADVGERPRRRRRRRGRPASCRRCRRRASPAGTSRAAGAPGPPCRRRRGPGPPARSGRSGRRTARWRSRRRRRPARSSSSASAGRRPPAASRRPRACRRRSPPAPAAAWVALGVQTCTMSTSSAASKLRGRVGGELRRAEPLGGGAGGLRRGIRPTRETTAAGPADGAVRGRCP